MAKPAKKRHSKKASAKPAKNPPAAIVKVEKPEESLAPTIKGTVANLERLRRFVSRCLNMDLQQALAKLPEGKELEPAQRERLEIDWGTIPGVDKPFLKQPGAEKFLLWLNLRPEYSKRELDMGNGHLEIVASVRVFHKKTKELVFEGPDCSCSTMESNFRFRWAEVPKPANAEEIKAAGMGRFRKKKIFAHGKYTGDEWVWQQRVENSNIHDERNKVRQMGEKRALVKCIRNMGALSEIFTADPSEWDIPFDDDDPLNDMDFTAGGRRIVKQDGTAPSGRPVGYQHGSKQAAQEVGKRIVEEKKAKITEHEKASAGANGQRETVSDRAASQPQTTGQGPQTSPQKIVTVTFPSESAEFAYVSGEIASLVPWIKGQLRGEWDDIHKGYKVSAEVVPDLQTACVNAGHRFQSIVSGPPKGAPKDPPAGHSLHTGIVTSVKQGTTTKGQPDLQVLCGGTWFYCFVKPLFEFLEYAKNKECVLAVDGKPPKIIGIRRIGNRHFEEDGRTPIVQNSEDRPKGTADLFT